MFWGNNKNEINTLQEQVDVMGRMLVMIYADLSEQQMRMMDSFKVLAEYSGQDCFIDFTKKHIDYAEKFIENGKQMTDMLKEFKTIMHYQ